MLWLLVLIITCLLYYSRRRLSYFSTRGVKTLPPIPFFGNLTAVTFGRENFVEATQAGYNTFKDERYFGLYQYLVPAVVTKDPEVIKNVLVRDFNAFIDRGIHINVDSDPLFGRNLIMLTGSSWRSMRTALSPAFSVARCRNMVPLMEERARAVGKYLHQHIHHKQTIDIDKISRAYVNDVIASCAFGFAVDSLQEPDNCIFKLAQKAIVQDTTQIMKFFGYENMRVVMKLLNVKIISSEDAEQFSKLFKSALQARRENQVKPRPDFIHILVEATRGKSRTEDGEDNVANYTDDDMVAQAVMFYTAGFDTSVNLINYFLYEMAINQHVQDKLQEELDRMPVVGDLYEAVQGLEYMDMCISEVLRLWPIVSLIDRKAVTTYDFGPTREGCKDRLVVPPGVHVWIPIFCIHRDPKHWPEPDKCIPERFSPDRKGEIVPYTYMPFGIGPRHCIGSRFGLLAVKVLLCQFLRSYSMRALPSTRRAARIHPRAFIMRPAHGFELLVEPRHNNIVA